MADLAADCGYSDQAVFARECREFAGVTPRELVKALLPDRGGFVVDEDVATGELEIETGVEGSGL